VEVEVTYGEHGDPPPAHLHPDQDEAFEVLAGVIHARIDGEERTYGRGERFEIPRGVAHQMWNPADQPARAIWRTSPPGRTHEWFAALDELQRSGVSRLPATAALLAGRAPSHPRTQARRLAGQAEGRGRRRATAIRAGKVPRR
jgi:hypothetical protein